MKTGNNSMSAPAVPTNGQDRRRSTRYRSSESLMIRCLVVPPSRGVSVEISEGGMSAMANGLMRVGDLVELEPVAGGSAAARVRHKLGQLYGFEFVELRPEQVLRIAECCKISQAGRTRAGTI
jgi:hypothetical protein